jgi:putative alpha-1,2-mannosidase
MYHYANKPGLTADRVRDFLSRSPLYNTSIWGLPGNDGKFYLSYTRDRLMYPHETDSGAMGSYVAFNLMGIYPLPTTKQFLVSSPFFPRITIHNPLYDSRTTIISHNFDGHDGRNIYIKVRVTISPSI